MPRQYLEGMLLDSLRSYAAAIPTATRAQRITWLTDRRIFIGVWPFDTPTSRDIEVINRAMRNVVHAFMTPRDALSEAQRFVGR